jgi:glycine cleavage system regulatory protein
VSAGLLFKARGLLHLPASLDPERLRDELEAVASDLMVDLHMHKEL